MSRPRRSVAALALAILCGWGSIALACTSIVVSRGASKDGSVMVTYSADAPFMPKLLYVPGGTHKAGELIQVRAWEDDRLCGPVKQVANTYSVVGLMNEHQLSLGETTTGGRRELRRSQGDARLRRPHALDPPACPDRARGDQDRRRARPRVWLSIVGRDVLDRRPE